MAYPQAAHRLFCLGEDHEGRVSPDGPTMWVDATWVIRGYYDDIPW
jgi:hypothetical protein